MSPTVASVEVLSLAIPFRFAFAHHLAERREARPQVVRVRLSDGSVGYGEALPRPYLTGETEDSVRAELSGPLAELVLGRALDGLEGAAERVASAEAGAACARAPAAFCGLELALLDAAGRSEGRSAGALLGDTVREGIGDPAAVVGFLPAAALRLFLSEVRRREALTVKVKVGRADDAERLALVRRTLGDAVALVVDANAAWTPDEAEDRIRELEAFGLLAVEQPVAREDVEGLARVRARVRTPVVADESLCTRGDADRLLAADACDLWNLRVGKCGGLLATLELARLADANGVGCALGVLVGESGSLEAAGRLLAARRDFRWIEREGAGLKRADPARPVAGPGLGVAVDDAMLDALADGPRLVEG